MRSSKLTVKQEKFVLKYLECGNASEAYRHAYDCSKMSDETVWKRSSELLQNGEVTGRVGELQQIVREKSEITKEWILNELKCIVDAKITDYLDFDGNTLRFKDFKKLTEGQIKAVESIKDGKNGIELKLHGKAWTIERICRMLGFDSPSHIEHTGKDGGPIEGRMAVEDHKVIFERYRDD